MIQKMKKSHMQKDEKYDPKPTTLIIKQNCFSRVVTRTVNKINVA
jgi:hypothetical protein